MKKKSLNVKKTNPSYINNFLNQSFINSIFKKFERKLNPKESYIVAVSGGPDSLALAFLAKCYENKYNSKIYYYHIDHNLRAESSEEAAKVVKILKKINVRCKVLKLKGKKPKSNIQSNARLKRYSLLIGECFKVKSKNILLAHHNDDVGENFFIRMTRGSGLKGLVSMGEKSKFNKINQIRPFIDLKKKELEKISLFVFRDYIKDRSNSDNSFKRIRIRNLMKNLHKEGLDDKKLNLTIQNLKNANNALEYYSNKNIEDNSYFNVYDKKVTLNKKFFSQPNEIILRSLTKLIQKIGNKYYPPRGKSACNLIDQLKICSNVKNMTLGGCLFKKVNETIIISQERG